MMRRMTIQIDDELLQRAEVALGTTTIRATVEVALRRASEAAEHEFEERRKRQLRFFDALDEHLDLDVLASDEMWR